MLVFGGVNIYHTMKPYEFLTCWIFLKLFYLFYVEIFKQNSIYGNGRARNTWNLLVIKSKCPMLDTNNAPYTIRVLGDFHDVVCHWEICHGSIAVPKDLTKTKTLHGFVMDMQGEERQGPWWSLVVVTLWKKQLDSSAISLFLLQTSWGTNVK